MTVTGTTERTSPRTAPGGAPAGSTVLTTSAEPVVPSAIGACLARLDEAIDAAGALGIDTVDARAVRDVGRERLRFPGATYVLALAGGTGVGKSSLLNALAGIPVSAAGVRRPTTSTPVAWVPSATRAELAPLLAWLGITAVRPHESDLGAAVAIVDLPDLDSIAPENRAIVDELLPRVDAVAWVTDPEKYADLLFHDEYLRTWSPRLARQVVIINKRDRLPVADPERLRDDLARRLRTDGMPGVEVLLASAAEGPSGTDELRRWLAGGAEAKQVVASRLAADAGATVAALAARAGVDGAMDPGPLVSQDRRARALDSIVVEALRTLDLDGLERQAVAATRQAARPRGGGPVGQITSRLYRVTGRASAVADPAGYLRRWRERGTLVRALVPLRDLVTETLPRVPAAARPGLAAVGEGAATQARLAAGIDRAVTSPAAGFTPPTSRLWPLVGVLQHFATGAIVLGALWLFAIWLGAGPPSTTDVPLLGAVPLPVLLIAAGLVAGVILGRAVSLHASWIGHRWARTLRGVTSDELRLRLADVVAPLDAIESARSRLAVAAAAAARECRPRR